MLLMQTRHGALSALRLVCRYGIQVCGEAASLNRFVTRRCTTIYAHGRHPWSSRCAAVDLLRLPREPVFVCQRSFPLRGPQFHQAPSDKVIKAYARNRASAYLWTTNRTTLSTERNRAVATCVTIAAYGKTRSYQPSRLQATSQHHQTGSSKAESERG
jgi:hypothetical protein